MRLAPHAPVVLLHGTAGKASQWANLASHLPRGYELRIPSLPGYDTDTAFKTGGRVADEAYAIARATVRPGECVHLVGHSYGGALALKLAMAWPERVKSLTLIEPAVFHLLRDGGALERQMYADIAEVEVRVRKASAAGDAEAGVAHFVDFWCGAGSWTGLVPEKRQVLVAQSERIIGNFTSVARENWLLSECAMVKVPTLTITGTASPVLVQHLTRLIAGEIAGARVIAVSDAGHMLPFTHAALVGKFLTHHFLQSDAAQLRMRRAA